MDYDDLGYDLPLRDNGKGSDYSQKWTPETPTTYADGTQAPPSDWLGYVRCGVCGRPLDGYRMVPGPNSEEFEVSPSYRARAGRSAGEFRSWLGWAWKISHPTRAHPGRPQEYHKECRLMLDGWARWMDAQEKVKFDPVHGQTLIQEWQRRLQDTRNGDFGSGRFSPSFRRQMFGRGKKDSRPRAERKTKRVLK